VVVAEVVAFLAMRVVVLAQVALIPAVAAVVAYGMSVTMEGLAALV
jgi:hypothetical protein